MNVRKWINARKNVLVLGETGVGKSYFVRNIAKELNKKIIQINITNLSKDLIESELFGHKKGAFSGATADKLGLCDQVGDGILFIDEIGEMSLELQAKLLLLLEEGEYRAVGACEVKQFKGTVVLATNQNLNKLVSKQEFREDLYFRINVFQHRIETFKESKNYINIIYDKIQSLSPKLMTQKLERFLLDYSWPGNYRELNNVFEYLSLIDQSLIDFNSLPHYMKENKTEVKENDKSYYKALELFEMDYFKRSLSRSNFNITKCSERIGISKVTLISKIKKYDLKEFISQHKELRVV